MKSALKNDDAIALKKLINIENINTCFETGNSKYSLLNLTIKVNAKTCFKLLIDQKADVNKECTGKTSLMYTAKYGRLEMAKLLIANNADIKKEYKGRTAIDYAKRYEKEDILAYLEKL